MKLAYLILAHNTPVHLGRLVQALASDQASFYIHVDAKSDLTRFAVPAMDRVQVLSHRIPVYWADYSMVQATLELLRAAVAGPHGADYFVLLSGSDYPIQPTSYVERFFELHAGEEFMDIVEMPHDSAGKPFSRLTTYHPCQSDSRLELFAGRVLRRLGWKPPARDPVLGLGGSTPYGGSTWWAISRAAAEHTLQFVNEHPRIVRFFRHTVVPDEGFFHTILGNSEFRTRMRRNLTYRDFSAGRDSPELLADRHLDAFESALTFEHSDHYGTGEVLFARKFTDGSGALLDRLDWIRGEKARRRGD